MSHTVAHGSSFHQDGDKHGLFIFSKCGKTQRTYTVKPINLHYHVTPKTFFFNFSKLP